MNNLTIQSPYFGQPEDKWEEITNQLIREHPLSTNCLVNVCLHSWNQMFTSSIGELQIGRNFFPNPQIIGAILHALIPLNISRMDPTHWRTEQSNEDKDINHINNSYFSIELKTSSHLKNIFGNRSYAQPQTSHSGKNKNGYYLTVNFEKFDSVMRTTPQISIIRFGWIEHTDWIPQAAATGQQARLNKNAYSQKLKIIYQKPQIQHP